jgi:hypothetical protein
MEAALREAYALQLMPLIPEVAKDLCYGCHMGQSAQHQHHVCLMTDYEEQVSYCLREAVARLNDKEIITQILSGDDAWRARLWKDRTWRDAVVEEIVKLRTAEYGPAEMEDALREAYALQLMPLIPEVAKDLCNGCQIGHGSQHQHDVCLMTDSEEQVNYCLREAVARLDEEKIISQFLSDDTRRARLWKDRTWRDAVVKEIVKLRTAECNGPWTS